MIPTPTLRPEKGLTVQAFPQNSVKGGLHAGAAFFLRCALTPSMRRPVSVKVVFVFLFT